VTAQTQSGTSVHGEARLTISQARDADWQLGSQRYDLGMVVDFTRVCDLTLNASDVPKNAACAECHSKTTGLSVEYTPLQTAGFADDALIAIFSQGMRPVELTFENPLLQGSADADCVFKSFIPGTSTTQSRAAWLGSCARSPRRSWNHRADTL
jgi:hypothetical protein